MVTIKEINESDLEYIRQWRNLPHVMAICREYRLLTEHDQKRWYKSYLKSRRTSDFDQEFYIIAYGNVNIGVGGFTRIEWKNRKAELSFYIAETQTDKKIEECLKYIINIGFDRFGFNKIYFPVYEHNSYLPLYKTIMKEEAILYDEYWWNGQFMDRHILTTYNTS